MTQRKKAAEAARIQEVERLQQMLTEGVQNYLTDERYLNYLKSVAKFHQYSARNSMLILMQRPEATAVASYMDWKHKFHRYVKAGEHGIRIIAPIARRRPAQEEEEAEKPAIRGFRAATVFDVAQTDGQPLPDLLAELTETVPDYEQLAAAVSTLTDFRIVTAKLPPDTHGLCQPWKRTICLRPGLSESMAIKTLLHEIAHAKLHPAGSRLPKQVREIQAESVAYIVCAHLGIDTSDYSFGYLVSWGAVDRPHFFREAMPEVVSAARELIQGLDHCLRCPAPSADETVLP